MGNCFSTDIGTRDYYESRGPISFPTTSPTPRIIISRKSNTSLTDTTSLSSSSSTTSNITHRRRHRRRSSHHPPPITIVHPPPPPQAHPHPRTTYVFGANPHAPPPPSNPLAHIVTVEPAGSNKISGAATASSSTGTNPRRRIRPQREYSRSWTEMRRDARRKSDYVRPYESLIHQVHGGSGGGRGVGGGAPLGGTVGAAGGGYKIQLPEEMLKGLFYTPKVREAEVVRESIAVL